jgi:hypothetical protein
VVVIRDNVVDHVLVCKDACHAELTFFDQYRKINFTFDQQYDEEDCCSLLEDGYFEFPNDSVCLTWPSKAPPLKGKRIFPKS